jgi:hypothetical protein
MVKTAETAIAGVQLCKHVQCARQQLCNTQQWSKWEVMFSTQYMSIAM